jgi:hypothetical protein
MGKATVMDDRASAEIIPFPRSFTPPSEASPPAVTPGVVNPTAEQARERLLTALASLEAALAGQREAVSRWRSSVGELRGTMAGLGDSMQRYRDRLGALGTRVSTLNGEAKRLEEWSDDRRREATGATRPQAE